uniref:Cytochrome p450 3044B1 n=1 Tax=Brachionus koreanus TaxID=1199090 RepID=W8SGR5_9BILA|nr:cytochrome p450 3044B1 [Brachionus koreanus]
MIEIVNVNLSTTWILIYTGLVIGITSMITNWLRMRRHFDKLNIPGPKPLPIIGNFNLIIKHGLPYNDLILTQKYGKTLGFFMGSGPVVETTDLRLIKSVLIKDFSIFTNRKRIEAMMFEPYDHFLSLIKDEEWKSIRAVLSTSFTSGKLKSMSKLMMECSNQLNNHLKKVADQDGTFNGKDYFEGFTLDVICSCCFGFSVDSINDPNNEIIKHLKNLFLDSMTKDPRFMLIILFPKLATFLRKRNMLELFPKSSIEYLQDFDFYNNAKTQRINQNIEMIFIQSMIEHEENVEKNIIEQQHLSDDEETNWNLKDARYFKKKLTVAEIFSQAAMFLIAGMETTANTLNLIAYNLAKHQDVQQKLIDEVDQVLENNNGEIDHETVKKMSYMSMVIDETLRMFPAAVFLERLASQDFEFEGMKIEKGQKIVVPLWALHRDPDLYPEPDNFDPERFSDQNKLKRDSNAYLPFGNGPRNCLGMRFALLEIKLALTNIMTKFRFETCEKTPTMIEIDSSGFARPKIPVVLQIKIDINLNLSLLEK